MILRILFLASLFVSHLGADVITNPTSSYPYISGHTFRAFCDHAINKNTTTFNAQSVKDGDTIFLCGDNLSLFFKKFHPKIQAHYILVTHDTIYTAPGGFSDYLNDDKLVLWFGKNTNLPNHPKMVSIPIGLANNHWGHGKTALFDKVRSEINRGALQKDKLLYMNFQRATYKSERDYVYDYFKTKPFCIMASKKPVVDYLHDLASSQFVLSPRGAGVDCHRTWEALLMGSYPIVKSSFLDVLFEDLPVVIIKDWKVITPDFLEQKYQEFVSKEFNLEKLFAPYWLALIQEAQDAVRAGLL